jgi:hypothetical protein
MNLIYLIPFFAVYPLAYLVARWLVGLDVSAYKNPATRGRVSKTYPDDPTDKQLRQMFIEQNTWEVTLFLIGYTVAGLLLYLLLVVLK